MIYRHGSETARTVMMKNVLKTFFKNQYDIDMEPEQSVSTGRADMLGFVKDGDRIKDAIVVEIKQMAQDFYTGYGMNFRGTRNYLAVPSELVGFAIEFLRNNEKPDVGVLEVTDKGTVRTVLFPTNKRDNDYVRLQWPAPLFSPVHLRNVADT